MDDSKFCLCPRGITFGTRRLFEALFHGCIPIVVSSFFRLPFVNTNSVLSCIVHIDEQHIERDLPKILENRNGDEYERQKSCLELRAMYLYHSEQILIGDATYNALQEAAHQRDKFN